ncbi:MAG TPA: SHOCT domain-containing protein [Methanomassiliicoccales archaeon]|nr:SHOCT domain-containing protein [Methanomassiliicoccales archaeon]
MRLTAKEEKEFSIGLLREWWIAATQCLVDAVGSEKALALIKPHFVHAGKAGGHVFQKISGGKKDDIRSSQMGMGMAFAMTTAGQWGVYVADDDSTIGEMKDCATEGQCREACIAFCDYGICAAHVEVSPSYEMRLIRSLAFGDGSCMWLSCRKGTRPKVEPTKEFYPPTGFRPPFVPSEELSEYLSLAWLGEVWLLPTRAFIEEAGWDVAMRKLMSYMRHSGMSTGIALARRFGYDEGHVDSSAHEIQLIRSLHNMREDVIRSEDSIEGTVEECPFSSSLTEACSQYEAFCNGICEAIAPGFEFSYDRMMTKGDKTCHWTIRKRAAHDQVHRQSNAEQEESKEMLKALKWRLAKGEITEDEFKRHRELLDQ